MAIDLHAHLARHDPEAPPFLAHMFDVEAYLEAQEQAGIELTALSFVPEGHGGPGGELERARAENEFIREQVEAHPGRFAAFAGVNPFGGDDWLEEGRRALDAGAAGLCFPTSRGGRYLDTDEAQGALALANDAGVPVFLHPAESPVGASRLGDEVLEAWIGRLFDTGICLSRLLLADTLSGYPNVRLIVAHSGGMLPLLFGRLNQAYETFERRAAFGGPPGGGPPGGGPPGGGPPGGGPPGGGPPGNGPPGDGPPGGGPPDDGPPGGGPPKGAPRSLSPEEGGVRVSVDAGPLEQRGSGQLFLDTSNAHPIALRAAIEAVGIDHLVFGSDYPPAGDSPKQALEAIDSLGLDSGDREKVLKGNASGLLDR